MSDETTSPTPIDAAPVAESPAPTSASESPTPSSSESPAPSASVSSVATGGETSSAQPPTLPPAPSPEADALTAALQSANAQISAVYVERNACVAALARAARGLGLRAWLGRHPDDDASWDPDWRNIVFILLPAGQVSWHIHDSELPAFAFLRDLELVAPYDGHSTLEKYERLAAFARGE